MQYVCVCLGWSYKKQADYRRLCYRFSFLFADGLVTRDISRNMVSIDLQVYSELSATQKKTNRSRPEQNGRHIADDIFVFCLKEECSILIQIKFVPKWQFHNRSALIQVTQSTDMSPTKPEGVNSTSPWIILCMRPANERRRHNVTSSLNGRAHAQNDPWSRNRLSVPCWQNIEWLYKSNRDMRKKKNNKIMFL